MKRNFLILGATVFLFGGLLLAKLNLQSESTSNAQAIAKTNVKVYLFLNEKDQDESCSKVYSLFDEGKSKIPAGTELVRVDVNNEAKKELFKKYGIRILPTILFLNSKDEVKARIEGEGPEVEGKINEAFKNAAALLEP